MRSFISNFKKTVRKKQIQILVLIALLPLLCSGFLLPAQYQESFLGALPDKIERLRTTEGARIILIGGSGTVFGIDSEMIARELEDYEIVNFGMYAGLGTKVMLQLAQKEIHPGDLVLYLPEQQEQAFSSWFRGTYFWQSVDGNPSLLLRLPTELWGQMLGTYPGFVISKLRLWWSDKTTVFQGVYRRDALNQYGDLRGELLPENQMPEGYDPAMPVCFPMPRQEYLDWLNRYAADCADKDAVFCFYHCPVNALAVDDQNTEPEVYETELKEKLHFPILGKLRNSMMDASYFYDTNFHLNGEGKTIYTWQLIRDIKAFLGDNRAQTPLEVCLAEQKERNSGKSKEPESGQASVVSSPVSCFLFAESGEQLILIGLSEEGRAMQELVVPVQVEGRNVVRIAEAAFQGAATERIRIPSASISLEDGAFSDCDNLKAIILMEEDPSRIHPGQNLLAGSDAAIYVPEKLGNRYRLSYNWSAYSDRIKEGEVS